jgi:hypothetical protein
MSNNAQVIPQFFQVFSEIEPTRIAATKKIAASITRIFISSSI